MRSPVKYFLQNCGAGYLGNSPFWWKKGGDGYTPNIDEAEEMTAKECNDIIRGTKGTHSWKKWSKSKVLKASYRTVDVQLLRK